MSFVSKAIHISDTIHGSIPISYLEKKVISTRIFNRLHNISQNSTAYLTFPTNRTRRFEHSIGTMHLTSQMYFYGISNSSNQTIISFFNDFKTEIDKILLSKLIGEGDSVYREKLTDNYLKKSILVKYNEKIEINDYLYKANIPKQIYDNKLEVLYIILFQSVRLAAMLHDVGHPPMSHITENAIKNIWRNIKVLDNRNERQNEFYECISQYDTTGKKFELHEIIGVTLSKRLIAYTIEKYDTDNVTNNLYKTLFELLVMDVTINILDEKTDFFKWIHRIIDGSLDCDRLDYVSRDPINSGIDAGKIEYDRLLSTIKLIKYEDNSYWFCPHIKMIDIVDDFFYRRWTLYKKIIFHHRVVKTDYLLENCIEDISNRYFENSISYDGAEPVEGIIPYDISGVWKSIKGNASHNEFFDTVLQWDDDWLTTILKRHFYQDYKIKEAHERDNTYYKLQELISNKKSYFSLLKKDEDLILLDRNISSIINQNADKLLSLISKLQSIKISSEGVDTVRKTLGDIQPYLDRLQKFIKLSKNKIDTGISNGNYILSYFRFELSILIPVELVYNKVIEESLSLTLNKSTDVLDYFFHYKPVKTGINENLMLYSENTQGETNIHIYEKISNKNEILEGKRNSLIPVYIYIRKKQVDSYIDFDKIINELGENIGKSICKLLENQLSNLIVKKEE